MTDTGCSFDNFYPVARIFSVLTQHTPLKFPPPDSPAKLFFPIAGMLDVHRPSSRRRILATMTVDKFEQCGHLGSEYAIAHLYDKYRRHLSPTTLTQTGRTLLSFLSIYETSGRKNFEILLARTLRPLSNTSRTVASMSHR